MVNNIISQLILIDVRVRVDYSYIIPFNLLVIFNKTLYSFISFIIKIMHFFLSFLDYLKYNLFLIVFIFRIIIIEL